VDFKLKIKSYSLRECLLVKGIKRVRKEQIKESGKKNNVIFKGCKNY